MKILAIHDMAGFGRSSMTTIISVLSNQKHQCVPLPTAVFSTHTAISGFKNQDLTDFAKNALEHYQSLDLKFDAIYSGFLCSCEQIDMVAKSFEKFPNSLKMVDPVMGDNGKVYKSYTNEMCEKVGELVIHADIITPNITECKIILGIDQQTQITTTEQIIPLLESLSKLGPKRVVITGIAIGENLITAWFDDGAIGFHSTEFIDCYFPGTGDLFASLLLSKLLHNLSLEDCVKFASDFVVSAIKNTIKLGSPPLFGVEFEQLM